MSDLKERDVVTAASIIADRHMVGLKVEDIKKAMVSAMLEYADLRERKQANGADSKPANCAIFDVSNSLPEAFGEWILMCCYEPNGLDGWIRWYDVNYEGEKNEKIYTTKELFEQFKDFSEKWDGVMIANNPITTTQNFEP